jgi:hypothetical protein
VTWIRLQPFVRKIHGSRQARHTGGRHAQVEAHLDRQPAARRDHHAPPAHRVLKLSAEVLVKQLLARQRAETLHVEHVHDPAGQNQRAGARHVASRRHAPLA